MSTEFRQHVCDLLEDLPRRKLDALKELFWTELNYERADTPLSIRDWPDGPREALAGPPALFATAGQDDGFHVIYCRLAGHLRLGVERQIINRLLNDHPYALFIFSDESETHWHFVNVRYEKEGGPKARRVFRRITVGPHERLRTATERAALLDVNTMAPDPFGLSPLLIQECHDEAFDVEKVTEEFFGTYQTVFRALQSDLQQQTGDVRWAHDCALQFLNRIMFLYFVQRKRWLGGDPEFLHSLWKSYHDAGRPVDTFVDEWLSSLFFEAFNNKFQAGRQDRQYLPPDIRDAFALAPFLNGGLFEPNELDGQHSISITDARFSEIFSFLEGYNFTISEDSPLDQEVAVDPEMIGKVYESLVNVTEEADERGEAGIFYTPRVEIDLMCRLTLVDWLTNHLGTENKPLLYEVVFAFDEDDKARADRALAGRDLWPQLDHLLRDVTTIDPACGSGSFLVGMLYVLDDLLVRAGDQLGVEETPYERKKRIIGRSLYGVDVMGWAVHVAELRLWLQLVIDTELAQAELKFRPLLPNLSFNLRVGDSLVQEVGGMNLALRKGSKRISPQMKGQITRLKAEKLKFYNNEETRKYRTADALRQAELRLFRDLLDDRLKAMDDRLKEIANALRPQENLFGEVQPTQMALDQIRLNREQDGLQAERERVTRARSALKSAKDVPFVWDIAFVEVFEGEKRGFDIVVGNPPYVRQEAIRDPRQPAEEVTPDSKKAYKQKLSDSVYAAWPKAFGYNPKTGKTAWKLDKKSDLYIYFYFHGLSLLNEAGAFSFITSNSWLDVGYGKDLQQFLLTRGLVKLVIDNQARRSFASADVNTVIVLFGLAQDVTNGGRSLDPDHIARFVMLTVPFEGTLDAVIWEEVEESSSRCSTPEYRIHIATQAHLLESGMDAEKGKFAGDKWGGKYLRAPDIYWVIMEKCKDKLVRLGDIADVRRGFTTGANEFFYLDQQKIAQWGIEEEFLRPVVKSSRDCKSVWLSFSGSPTQYLFMCHRTRNELHDMNALKYIEHGVSFQYDQRPSCRNRANWYDLGERTGARINCNYLVDEVMRFFASNQPFLVSDNFQEIHSSVAPEKMAVACNSTVSQVFINISGRSNFGDGLLKIQTYEVADMYVPNPFLLDLEAVLSIRNAGLLKYGDYDRRVLDDIVFEALGLTRGERDAVYEAVIRLVETRLKKAGSLKRPK